MAKPPDPPAGLAAVTPGEWMKVWARVRAQPSVKLTGVMAAYFADYGSGAGIRPGTVILAAVCSEASEATVKRALSQIRDWGLLWRYVEGSKQGRRGMADEYRLTIPDDILNQVPMLTPEYRVPVDNPAEQVSSEHVLSEHVFSATGTGVLSDTEQVSSRHPTYPEHLTTHLATTGGPVDGAAVEGNGHRRATKLEIAAWQAAQSRAQRAAQPQESQ